MPGEGFGVAQPFQQQRLGLGERLMDERLGAGAEQFAHPAVDQRKTALAVEQGDAVVGGVQHRLHAVIEGGQHLILFAQGDLAGGDDVGHVVEGPRHVGELVLVAPDGEAGLVVPALDPLRAAPQLRQASGILAREQPPDGDAEQVARRQRTDEVLDAQVVPAREEEGNADDQHERQGGEVREEYAVGDLAVELHECRPVHWRTRQAATKFRRTTIWVSWRIGRPCLSLNSRIP